MRKVFGGSLVAVAMLLALALPVAATEKVTLCHATNSATNPWLQLEISENGLNGHKVDGVFHTNAKTGFTDFLLSGTDLDACDDTPDDLSVTPLAPAVSDATCEAAGMLALTEVEGVSYTIDPEYAEGDSGEYTVTATADEGFTIDEGAPTVFEVTVPAALDCPEGAEAVAPSVSAPTCDAPGALTLNAVEGISYSVEPSYGAGDSGDFTITATADDGFELSGATSFTVTVLPKKVCGEGTEGGNPPTGGEVPDTAMAGASSLAPIIVALIALTGLAFVARRNIAAMTNRR